jgi:hypothetical protein
MPATVTPPASHTSLLGYSGLLSVKRLDTGGQRRRVRIRTYGNVGNCDHAEKRNQ